MGASNVPLPGFIMWWRAAPRKRNAFFYFALGTWILGYVVVTTGMLLWEPARPWTPLVLVAFLIDLYLVRERLPTWAWPFPR